jgi:hypothetical protein
MTKILINASMLTKQPTGVGVYSIEMLKNLIPLLDKNFIQYDIFTYYDAGLAAIAQQGNIKKISLGNFLDSILGKNLSIHRLVWCFSKLSSLSKQYDLVYSLSTHGALNNSKQIITVHDLISLTFPKQHRLQYLYFKYLVPTMLRNARNVVAISKFTKAELVSYDSGLNADKIKVVYNGVDHLSDKSTKESDIKVLNITNGESYCLLIGASYPHKNAKTIIEVAKRLQESHMKIVIAGRQSAYYETLKQLAANQKINNIIFLNYVDEPLLSSLYYKAKLHIYISLYEGFGFPPAEAAFYQTDTIISSHAALSEIYSDCFYSVDPYDVEGIVTYIKSIDEEKANNGVYKQLVGKYNWSNASKNVFDCLVNV